MAIGPGNLRERQLKKLEEIIDEKISNNEHEWKIYVNCKNLPDWQYYEPDIIKMYRNVGWSEVYFDNDIYEPCLILKR